MFASKFMKTEKKLNRFIIFILQGVYILSFLLSPYFHHHHTGESNIQVDRDTFHSHLFNNPIKETSQEQEHSHSVDESSKFHSHFVKLSSAPTISTKRIVNIIPTFIAGINFARLNEAKNYPHKRIDVKPKNLKTQERYVLSATNVSPPLA